MDYLLILIIVSLIAGIWMGILACLAYFIAKVLWGLIKMYFFIE